MNTDFWRLPNGKVLDTATGEMLDFLLQRQAVLGYLDSTIDELNSAERELRITQANLMAVRKDFVEASVRVNQAFDTLRAILEELAYQAPYEDGQNGKIGLVIGVMDRLRRVLPEHELNDKGVPILSNDLPF